MYCGMHYTSHYNADQRKYICKHSSNERFSLWFPPSSVSKQSEKTTFTQTSCTWSVIAFQCFSSVCSPRGPSSIYVKYILTILEYHCCALTKRTLINQSDENSRTIMIIILNKHNYQNIKSANFQNIKQRSRLPSMRPSFPSNYLHLFL